MSDIFNIFSDDEQQIFLHELTGQLPVCGVDLADVALVLDARHLACPMPLLKTKVALRTLQPKQAVYLIASDKNSQTDLCAYCQKNALFIHHWQSLQQDTVLYHFIISQTAKT